MTNTLSSASSAFPRKPPDQLSEQLPLFRRRSSAVRLSMITRMK
jgi:hypothetical protein